MSDVNSIDLDLYVRDTSSYRPATFEETIHAARRVLAQRFRPGRSLRFGQPNQRDKRRWWSEIQRQETMRLRAWAWLALSSVWAVSLPGATRPRFGGTLTVELSTGTVDPASPQGHVPAAIAETLVRVNARGIIEPQLATAWQHEPDYKRWRFSLRAKVNFHDGEQLSAASAAPALLAPFPRYKRECRR